MYRVLIVLLVLTSASLAFASVPEDRWPDQPVLILEQTLAAEGIDAALELMHSWKGVSPELVASLEAPIIDFARELLSEGKTVAAAEILEGYIRLAPDSTQTHPLLARALLRRGDHEAAARYAGILMARREEKAFESIVAEQTRPLAETANEVIARALEAMGGREAVAALRTLRRTSNGFMLAGRFGATRLLLAPNRLRQERRDGRFIVTDHTQVWSVEGDRWTEINNDVWLKHHNISLDLLDYEEKGVSYEFAGVEPLDGAALYRLKKRLRNGDLHHVYFDVQTGLLVMEKDAALTAGSASLYFDYREVSGVLLPHMRVRIDPVLKTPHVETVVYVANEPIDPKLFYPPSQSAD